MESKNFISILLIIVIVIVSINGTDRKAKGFGSFFEDVLRRGGVNIRIDVGNDNNPYYSTRNNYEKAEDYQKYRNPFYHPYNVYKMPQTNKAQNTEDPNKYHQNGNNEIKKHLSLNDYPNGLTYEVTEHINCKEGSVDCRSKTDYYPKTNCPYEIHSSHKPTAAFEAVQPSTYPITTPSDYRLESSELAESDRQDGVVKKRQRREVPSIPLEDLLEGNHLIPQHIIEEMAQNNLTEFMANFLNQLDKAALLDVINSMKEEYISKATPGEAKMIEETFNEFSKSVVNMKQDSDKAKIKRTAEKSRPEMISDAAAVLELLAEDSSTKVKKGEEDEDDMYRDYYSDMSQETSDETQEPSFLELLSIATKHKAKSISSKKP